jgi:hypothetical protein
MFRKLFSNNLDTRFRAPDIQTQNEDVLSPEYVNVGNTRREFCIKLLQTLLGIGITAASGELNAEEVLLSQLKSLIKVTRSFENFSNPGGGKPINPPDVLKVRDDERISYDELHKLVDIIEDPNVNEEEISKTFERVFSSSSIAQFSLAILEKHLGNEYDFNKAKLVLRDVLKQWVESYNDFVSKYDKPDTKVRYVVPIPSRTQKFSDKYFLNDDLRSFVKKIAVIFKEILLSPIMYKRDDFFVDLFSKSYEYTEENADKIEKFRPSADCNNLALLFLSFLSEIDPGLPFELGILTPIDHVVLSYSGEADFIIDVSNSVRFLPKNYYSGQSRYCCLGKNENEKPSMKIFATIYLDLAEKAFKSEKREDALRYIEISLKLDSLNSNSHYNNALLKLSLANDMPESTDGSKNKTLESALVSVEKAISINPDFGMFYALRAQIKNLLAKRTGDVNKKLDLTKSAVCDSDTCLNINQKFAKDPLGFFIQDTYLDQYYSTNITCYLERLKSSLISLNFGTARTYFDEFKKYYIELRKKRFTNDELKSEISLIILDLIVLLINFDKQLLGILILKKSELSSDLFSRFLKLKHQIFIFGKWLVKETEGIIGGNQILNKAKVHLENEEIETTIEDFGHITPEQAKGLCPKYKRLKRKILNAFGVNESIAEEDSEISDLLFIINDNLEAFQCK